MIVLIMAMMGKVDVDIGGKIGVFHRFVQSEIFTLDNLEVDRASIEVKVDLLEGCDAKLEVDFSDNVNLKNAWIRYQPWEYLSIRAGRQKLPAGFEELTPYFCRPFLEHSWGNKWADDADYTGRGLGFTLRGIIPLGEIIRIRPLVGFFQSPSGRCCRSVNRLVIEYQKHHIAACYSSRSGLYETDSLLWSADLHLELPVSIDGEILLGPDMQAYSITVVTTLFGKALQPAIRYQCFDAPHEYTPEIQDVTFALTGQFKRCVRLQAEISVPLIKETTPVRVFTGIKVNF